MLISDWSSDVCSSDLRYDFEKIFHPLALPPRRLARKPGLIRGTVVANIDRRRCALDDIELLDMFGEFGDNLHRGGAGADHCHPLVGKLGQSARRRSAGIVIIPARRMEHPPFEVAYARYAGQLDLRDRKSTSLNSSH